MSALRISPSVLGRIARSTAPRITAARRAYATESPKQQQTVHNPPPPHGEATGKPYAGNNGQIFLYTGAGLAAVYLLWQMMGPAKKTPAEAAAGAKDRVGSTLEASGAKGTTR